MFKDKKKLQEDIDWFNSMSTSFKSQALEKPSSLKKEERIKFFYIIDEVRGALGQYEKREVVEKLEEVGLGAYAAGFVDAILKNVPPVKYPLINKIEEKDLKKALEFIMKDYILGNIGREEIVSKLELEEDVFFSILDILVNFLNSYLRSDVNLEQMEKFLIDKGLNKGQTEVYTQIIKERSSEYRDKIIFRYIQEIFLSEMKDLKETQKETNELLKELLNKLTGVKEIDPGYMYG